MFLILMGGRTHWNWILLTLKILSMDHLQQRSKELLSISLLLSQTDLSLQFVRKVFWQSKTFCQNEWIKAWQLLVVQLAVSHTTAFFEMISVYPCHCKLLISTADIVQWCWNNALWSTASSCSLPAYQAAMIQSRNLQLSRINHL